MIQLPRSFFRQLRAVLRKAFSKVHSPVVLQSGPDGLSVHCQQEGIAVAYQSQNGCGVDQLTLPAQALADLEGKGHDIVALETKGNSKIVARWHDSGIPRSVEYESVKANSLHEFPQAPTRWDHQDATFLKALDDAMQTASRDAVRFALNKIQVRGKSGVLIATDGHALLWQNGFQFPFSEDILLPRTNVFGSKELQGPINIAKTNDFCIQADPWTVFLSIDTESRFPRAESILPNIGGNATNVRLTTENLGFLGTVLPRLPANTEDRSPITFDLNSEVIIRAKGNGQEQSTEVVLAGAGVIGRPIRYSLNRHHLARAAELGFTEGFIVNVDSPMLFQDDRRKFVFTGLGKVHVVSPTPNDLRLRSDSNESTTTNHHPAQPRRHEPMRTPRPMPTAPLPAEFNSESNGSTNGVNNNGQHHTKAGFNGLLEEGQSIQNALRDLLLRTNRLMVGLKAYRRHAKTMQSTLASLRQLQQVEA